MILNGDVKKEISEIISGLSRDDRTLASLTDGIKIVSFYPLLMLGSNAVIWTVFYLKAILDGDNNGQPLSFYFNAFKLIMNYGGWSSLAVTAMLGMIFILMYVTPALLWLSIPEEIRGNSKIISMMKRGFYKIGILSISLGLLLSLTGIVIDDLKLIQFSIPTVFFISMFAFTLFLTLQSARFGLGPLMATAKGLLRK